MKARCTSDNRELILQILREETGAPVSYAPLPHFSFSIGGYTLRRDGWLETSLPEPAAFSVLASVGLCDFPYEPAPPEDEEYLYPMSGHSGATLLNLMCILSARQRLINRALDARNGFHVAPQLMSDLLAHPAATIPEFLQALYGREPEYAGVRFTLRYIALSGFRKGHAEEAHIRRQLADRIVRAALTQRWAKAFTRRVRNPKYAFRTWLNSIGMIGPEYEEARAVMLSRLPGRADQRSLLTKRRAG